MPDLDERFARTLHHASQSVAFGEPFTPPLIATSVYRLPGDPSGPYQYARWGNPTWTALEEALALLEDGETVTFPSGMAAIAAVFHALLKSGDRVLLPADGYYTVRVFAEKFLAPMGVAVDQVLTADAARHALDGYRMVWIETPSNPGLELADIAAVARNAKAAGALLVVDNTTMTPLGQRPLDLGADIVVSADTKALNGHSDVLLGHVSCRSAGLIAAVRDWRRIAGAIPGPFEAWLVYRGLETLELRFSRMCANALLLAQRLSSHKKIHALSYPWLASHPSHSLARKQMNAGGSLIAMTLADRQSADRFIERCDLMRASTSFGGVHTSAERRARWGDAVDEGFIRVSVGCEPGEVLWRSVERALVSI